MKHAIAAHGVAFRQVSKRFGSVQALRPLDLDVHPGEFLTLLGPSGSGKTTLLNIAAGFLDPDGGQFIIGDRDVTALPPRSRNIGMVFQNYALFPHMNVFDNVAYGLRVRGVAASSLRQRVETALAMVRLEGFGTRGIHQLSGGQQQRVALARAMVIEPDLLLMDEPLGALDRQLRKHVQLEIRRLHVEDPRTTVYVTHDQEEALVMSDRVAIMRDGRIEQIATPSALYENPANAYIATFLGESNLLPAMVLGADGDRTAFRVDGYDDLHHLPRIGADIPPGPALLLARPETIRPADDGTPGLRAVVEETVYLGELTAIRMRLASGQQIWMRAMNASPRDVGSEIRVKWDPVKARLLVPEQAE
ncbi:MAG: ABC transporter ATP-binding protein [Proteobacteria bacterium]|nr:ABC transporter ATP-binding protein [Pseudomonadota bacterium]